MSAAAHISQRAAGPLSSVWVSASAGTGKTTVLTERLLRLMLDGTDPARVLCLTFTRAAAAEMANRLDVRLAEWATMRPGALVEALFELTGRICDEDMIARARRLFALVLDSPGGIKIATIHAFCQALLRRFPLEAGVSPEFAVIEERGAAEAMAEAAQKIILTARNGDPALTEALSIVADHAAEERFAELIGELAKERGKLRRATAAGHAALRQRLSAALGVSADIDAPSLITAFCAEDAGDEIGLRAAAEALATGSKNDVALAKILGPWCVAPERRRSMVDNYIDAFLTGQRNIKTRLITNTTAHAARGEGRDTRAILAAEAERVLGFYKTRAAIVTREASCALARLGDALLRVYEDRKRNADVLDFDDLVLTARNLLRRPGVAPWVLFKLDGGLDHILSDEAQDTNPEQWDIVAALAEEFFAGEGANPRPRTIFAVGDAKQSIYSFQRADPQAFVRMRQHFQERVTSANQDWQILPLDTSFRSTEPVLRAVDAIFQQSAARHGVALDGTVIRHFAARTGHAGRVELWPAVPAPADDPDPETLPLVHRRVTEPWARLARAIAATIRQWLDRGERLEARDRRLRPGDIMVLVRRRNQFVGELLRALKERGIPVAGADRLVLTEQLAVQDLAALGRFLLFPEDDLTLATVLKGPLCDIDEDTLFALCHGRGDDRLWDRLRAFAGSSPRLQETADRLSKWLARADFVPPYELFAEILGSGRGRRALLRRLGPEAEDPIGEFLGLALAYERDHVPSLQGFLRWLVAGGTEVKRDFAAHRRDEIRILTVHGAKGLEAPVVFLPDTMAVPEQKLSLLWTEAGELPLWKPPGDHWTPHYRAEKTAWQDRQMQEYRRLLYVGLTRAQDWLYICGWHSKRAAPQVCWHTLCAAGLAGHAEPFAFDTTALIGADGWCGEGLRLESAQRVPPAREPAAFSAEPTGLPPWAAAPPPTEPDPPRPLVPSRPSGEEPPALSPLTGGGRDRFKRGLLVHRLLQSLPEITPAMREPAARRFLASPVHALATAEQDDIRQQTLMVLDDPEFAPLFGPGSQAEVPLVGLVGGRAVSGQIDRLVVTADHVLIVDYKTLRPVPASEAEVAPIYLRQLAIYRAALTRIYPGRDIRCALLWTEAPRLMPISPERLARHAP